MKKTKAYIIILLLLILVLAFTACDKPMYNIHFQTNGGETISPMQTDGSSVLESLPKPSQKGYIFMGWYYDNYTFREKFTKSSLTKNPIESDITVYAKWERDLSAPTEGLEYSQKEEGYEISGYAGDSKDIIIPPEYNGMPLIGIAQEAFIGQDIKSVYIPDSVEEIGEGAFKDCDSLKSITLPFIGRKLGLSQTYDAVFGFIFGFTDDISGFLQTRQNYKNGEYLYYYVPSSLKEVTVTQTNIIPYGAFSNCAKIRKITISNSVSIIAERAFYNCSNLGYIIIPENVTTMNKDAFLSTETTIYCERQEKPTLWSSSWANNSNLIYWDINPQDMGEQDGIQYLIVDDKIEISGYFGDHKKVIIPNTIIDREVVTIKSQAFQKRENIESLVIANSVKSIGFSALAEVSLIDIMLPFLGKTLGGEIDTHFGYIFGAISASSNIDCVPNTLKKVEITLTSEINDNAFLKCEFIEEIILPSELEEIGNSVFEGCLSLKSIDIPSSVENIGNMVFNGCKELESVILPSSLSSMGTSMFYNCEKLASVTMPQNITKLPNDTFFGCEKLEGVSLPSSLTEIGIRAFENCTLLSEITLPAGLNKIDSRAFYNCLLLEEINIPDELTIIGDYAFEGCLGLESIFIPNSVVSIGIWAFKDCDNLTIYAENSQRPSGWVDQWNVSACPVEWSSSP